MPIGMECGVDAVLFGYNTGSGVKSKNPFKNPIRIIIWADLMVQ